LEYLPERSADTTLHTVLTKPRRCRRPSRLPPGYHSIVGAALLVGRAPSGLYEEVRRGRLHVSRWRGRLLVHVDDLDRWLTLEPAEPGAQAAAPAREANHAE